ncbi:MAG: VWA domain-containing protein [Pirellulales bacterium]|nr:VWA domain-containing protein [Pirellulales bacterium]
MSRCTAFLTFLAILLAPRAALAQGVLVVVDPHQQVRLPRPIVIHHYHPHPPISTPPTPVATYKIKELELSARLTDQIARVQVSQTFVNTGSRQMEVSFVFPLPYDGAVEQMTLLVDGKEYPARLLDAKEARKLYEDIVRKNQDPALLEWMGTGLFKTSVFPVPAGASRTVSLRYSQICRMQDGLTDFLFPLGTAKYTSHPIEKVSLRVSIESGQKIKNVYSPTHEVKIKRPDDDRAVVTCTMKDDIPSSDFRLFYDVGKGRVGTRVLSYRPDKDHDGYFLLLASPDIKAPDEKPVAKTVVFVADRSGSMSGKKIEQARGALKFVLENLREGDLFNIIAYDSEVEAFRPELQRFDDENRKAALGFVEDLTAGGSTNIDAALRTALAQLDDNDRPSYVVFLTDGLPTAGVTNEMKIVEAAQKANDVRARLFVFGVGYDVNSRLLDRLARTCFGQSEYVRPDEDIEDRVSSLYRRIQSPVMTGVKIEFTLDESRAEEGKPVNRVYPRGDFDLFAGQQLVVVGRYRRPGAAKVVVSGKVGDETQRFDFTAKLVAKSPDESQAFIEKLWAVRRVGEILDELDLAGRNPELVEELVRLATRHGILTPYTSFLADDGVNLHDVATNRRVAADRLSALESAEGRYGFAQRSYKGQLQNALAAPAMMAPSVAGRSDTAAPGQAGMGGMGGFGGGLEKADRELQSAGETIRNVSNRAFYRRDNRWIDATLTAEQEKNPTRVKQFSRDYFDLAQRYGRELSQYLTFDEPVVVNLDGQAYLIER